MEEDKPIQKSRFNDDPRCIACKNWDGNKDLNAWGMCRLHGMTKKASDKCQPSEVRKLNEQKLRAFMKRIGI